MKPVSLLTVEIALLGPLEVRAGGGLIAISAPKERATLAFLALRAGTSVSSSQLIDALWGEDPPRSAHKALQTYVSNLRQALPDDSIVTTGAGYCLALSADDVDVGRFEALAVMGTQRLAESDPSTAERFLREALSLWRGAPLVELARHPVGAAWQTHLEELRSSCEEDLAEARIALDDQGPLVAELEMAVAAQPLRERRWSQLIRVLYREGRQADALRAFQRLRTNLAEGLGIAPSVELRDLEAAVLAQDPALRGPRPPALADMGGVDGSAARPLFPNGDGTSRSSVPVHHSGTGLETTTVLFTDLVDSTARAASLDPEAADQLRRTHFSLLRTAITAHNGSLVKSLGDGVMAVFSSPSEALSCAVTMQQSVEYDNRRRAVPQGLRIGVSAGEVAREGHDYFGDPVVEASRLCALAESGQILAAAVVPMLAGRRTAHDLSPWGDLQLKGFAAPVSAVQLNWLPLPPGGGMIPFPRQLRAERRFGFCGRARELESLVAALDRAVSSRERIVATVSGEPGIGKTTLAAAVAEELGRRGTIVLYGRCDEDLRLPYQPFVEALTQFVANAPPDVLADHVATHGGELVRLVPILARRVPSCPAATSTEPDAERHLAFGAAVGLLEAASSETPVLLVLDDLHWADKPSLQLLRYVVAAPELSGVVVLVSYRSSEVGGLADLQDALASLRRDAAVMSFELAGLNDDEVVELAAAAAGHPLDESSAQLARAVCARTAGNPFFVVEIIRHLAEAGVVVQDDEGRWSADVRLEDVGLPQSVREVVSQRVRRLGEPVQQLLSAAAVIGLEFDVALLLGTTGTAEDNVLDGVELALDAALVVETAEVGTYAFGHALVQQTLYDGLGSARRRRAHQRVAEALERRVGLPPGSRAQALAHHWSRAGDVAKSLHYTQEAGQAALDDLAPDEAARWFEAALVMQAQHVPSDTALRCDLLIGLGTAQRTIGDPRYRATLLEAGEVARARADAPRMAEAALASYRGFWSAAGRVDEDKVAALESTLSMMPDADSPERAQLLATLCNELTFSASLDRRREIAGQAIGMARRLGDPATLVRVLTAVFDASWGPTVLSERLADTELAQALAESAGDPVACFSAARYRWRAASAAGLIDEADRCLDRMQELSAEVNQPLLLWIATFARGCRALLAGDPDEAERVITDAFRFGTESGQPDALVFYQAAMSHVRWQQGRLGEFVEVLEQAAEANPGIPGHWAALTRALCEADRAEEARALLGEGSAKAFTHLPEDSLQLSGLVMYAETAVYLSEATAAEMLYEILRPWEDQWVNMGVAVDGPVAHFLGGLATVLGDLDAAEAHLTRALDMAASAGAKFFVARTEFELARMLIGRGTDGDLERARGLLRSALSASERHGYRVVSRRARAELDGLVTPSPHPARPSGDGGPPVPRGDEGRRPDAVGSVTPS